MVCFISVMPNWVRIRISGAALSRLSWRIVAMVVAGFPSARDGMRPTYRPVFPSDGARVGGERSGFAWG